MNIFKEHRQTIQVNGTRGLFFISCSLQQQGNMSDLSCLCDRQYIHPGDAVKLGQAELLVIDEAAAIPLPLVKKLLGPYLVFMSSTINGSVMELNLPHQIKHCFNQKKNIMHKDILGDKGFNDQ